MASYLDIDGFKALTVMPSAFVDDLEIAAPGFLAANLDVWSEWINTRLRKRYAAPFAEPVPGIVKLWLSQIVTRKAFEKQGWRATDEQAQKIYESDEQARAEVKEAADSVDGLFDLPLRQDTTATGISKGGPFSYSEQSPYVFTDAQADTARAEDDSRGGSFG